MPKRDYPHIDEVKIVYVYPGAYGFRYTARGWDNRVIYDSKRFFKSRFAARAAIHRRWPGVRVSFETI